jgi:hypothetical protein
MNPPVVRNYRDASYVASLTGDAVHAGVLSKFLYIYTELVKSFPAASLRLLADEALSKALGKA